MEHISKLDNPVWYSLSETHQNHVINFGNIKFYKPDYAPFGAIKFDENIAKALAEYSKLIKTFLIVGSKPKLPENVTIVNRLSGLQMVTFNKIDLPTTEKIIKLNSSHLKEVLGLVKLVYPEYFKEKTFYMGNYYGIFKNNQLAAITGERMQTNDFIEVSAVITHPNHTRQGYAKQLIAHTVNTIISQGKIPFLHVAESNTGPIKLYESLGFTIRREMSFWVLTRK